MRARDPDARLHYRLAGAAGYVYADGTPAVGEPRSAAMPIARQSHEIAVLVPGSGDPQQAPELRRAILEAVALTFEIARRRIDVRRSLAESTTPAGIVQAR